MSAADVVDTIERHEGEYEQERTDELYVQVKQAFAQNVSGAAIKDTLEAAYAGYKIQGCRRERRVVGFVLAYLDGASSPVPAL